VFAMSFAFAMVGIRFVTIDSSRFVATWTGQFKRFARRMITF
jgi:hypothetical protein